MTNRVIYRGSGRINPKRISVMLAIAEIESIKTMMAPSAGRIVQTIIEDHRKRCLKRK